MSDPYGKLLERGWSDPEMQALEDRDFRIFCYLISNKHRTIAGIYYLPVPLAAHELKKRQDDLELAIFHRLTAWVTYDPRTEEVWVRNLASVNLDYPRAEALPKPKREDKPDKRVPALRKGLLATRSLWLRRLWLEYYGAWNDQLRIPLPSPIEAPTLILLRGEKPLGSPLEGASKPDSSNRYQVAGNSSSAVDSSNQPAEPLGSHKAEAGRLMPLVRQHFYIPDGKPPAEYDDGRDFQILTELLETVKAPTLEVAIEGLAMLRDRNELPGIAEPGEKLTMRALYHTHHGVLPTLSLAENAYWKHVNLSSRVESQRVAR